MRIATWNVNSLNARLERVEAWIRDVQPDVLCLQETKLADDAFPTAFFAALGYESAHHGEGRWNGVAVISRVGLDDVASGFDDEAPADPQARLIWATCGGIRVASAYVPNGRALDDDHYQYKLAWLERLHAKLTSSYQPTEPLLIVGDYNIAPHDIDVWNIAKLEGMTHVSAPERAALGVLIDWGLIDIFRERFDQEGLFSWWDYRGGSFHKRQGMRIDLLMGTRTVADRVTYCVVDRNARKGTKPSDHAPVLVDVDH